MSSLVAFLDACVLYPAPLRDLLMRLSTEGVFIPRWTEKVHDEWMSNLLANRPELSLERLKRTKDLMLRYNPSALVTDYEKHIPELTLPDPNDRHVLAAAVEGGCDVIVTFNLKDFPNEILATYDLIAISPDVFVSQCLTDRPSQVSLAIQKQQRSLTSPPCSMNELLQTLASCGLPDTVANLKRYLLN